MIPEVVREGPTLHGGGRTRARLVRCGKAHRFRRIGYAAFTLDDAHVVRADQGVVLSGPNEDGALDLVEHYLAALGGLGVRRGVALHVDGSELPILDGGARSWVEALLELGVEPSNRSSWRVAEQVEQVEGQARYRWSPSSSGFQARVTVQFPDPIGHQVATWDGSSLRFIHDIAPARTFGFSSDYDKLRSVGRGAGAAQAVRDGSLIVADWSGPEIAHECARHKLLDLVGDLVACLGELPDADVDVVCPGHAVTHRMVRRAQQDGVLVPA